jgi:hypothetical protein
LVVIPLRAYLMKFVSQASATQLIQELAAEVLITATLLQALPRHDRSPNSQNTQPSHRSLDICQRLECSLPSDHQCTGINGRTDKWHARPPGIR